mgnify:FL=1
MIRQQIIAAAPYRWRVLEAGQDRPIALCLHGAGASADSFAALFQPLSDRLHLIAPDLPGHGQTRLGGHNRSGLPQMAADIAALMRKMQVTPDLIIGHSAGAAIALALDPILRPRGHVLLYAALSTFDGMAGVLFPVIARGLAAAPFAADIAAATMSGEAKIRGLLTSTGAHPTDEMVTRYRALVRDPAHVKGALKMMAAWKLDDLRRALPDITTPVHLIAGREDGAVPADVSVEAARILPNASLAMMDGGHLLHEEDPDAIACGITDFLDQLDTLNQTG